MHQINLFLSFLTLFCSYSFGEIISTQFIPTDSLDLSKSGNLDWCVFTTTNGEFTLNDYKQQGKGIDRKIRIQDSDIRLELTEFTGVNWGWVDGTKQIEHTHLNGAERNGVRAWLPLSSSLNFTYLAGPSPRIARLLLRTDGEVLINAQQDGHEKTIIKLSGKKLGIVAVKFKGGGKLFISVIGNHKNKAQSVRGFATTLSSSDDLEQVFQLISLHEKSLAAANLFGEIDFKQKAIDFADCMLKFGTDRYGTVHSPLFATLLTRETEPKIGPQPYFDRPSPYDIKETKTLFIEHHYNRCLNYPAGLGKEGPHKVTFFGADIFEDRDLYKMLIDLSRITRDLKYKKASIDALSWWFKNTLGPADLYPWGEHLGWDFEYEAPTYFNGPSKYLYAACYHEIKDQVPFIDILSSLPSTNASKSYLDRYAIGVWKAHYWDKKRAIYCRHGDYTGHDNRQGSSLGFPAHQAAHLELWTTCYMTTTDQKVKDLMNNILNTVLDHQIKRAKRFGFIPFNFDDELQNKKPKQNDQSNRLANKAAKLSISTKHKAPLLSKKLHTLALTILGHPELQKILSIPKERQTKPKKGVVDLSKYPSSIPHANEILQHLNSYKQFGDPDDLKSAVDQAKVAYILFCDQQSPLPKAFAFGSQKTLSGDPFPDFYYKGARLMHAFALLGEALESID